MSATKSTASLPRQNSKRTAPVRPQTTRKAGKRPSAPAERTQAERAADRQRILRQYNPLAKKLAEQHQATIDAVALQVGSVADLWEPLGQTHCEKTHCMRRATDPECRVAMLGTAQTFDIDVTGDIAAQVVKKLTDYAKQLQAAAERVQAAVTAGAIAQPKAARRGKAVK